MVKLVLFVLPLGLDTFAVSATLGVAGLPKQQRLKISLLLSARGSHSHDDIDRELLGRCRVTGQP
jgi:hypothetical protein